MILHFFSYAPCPPPLPTVVLRPLRPQYTKRNSVMKRSLHVSGVRIRNSAYVNPPLLCLGLFI